MKKCSVLLAVAWSFVWVVKAEAYIGPGAGLGALGALIGVIVAVFLSIGVILSWPFRWLLRRLRGKRKSVSVGGGGGAADDTSSETCRKPQSGSNPS